MSTTKSKNNSVNNPPLPVYRPQKTIVKHEVLGLTQGIWQVKQGFGYTRTISSLGDYQLLGIWKPGDILMNPGDYFVYELKSIKDIVIEQVDPSDNPSDNIVFGLIESFKRTQQLLQITKTKGMEARLLEFLRWLGEIFGDRIEPNKTQAKFRLTHEEMAIALNSTRVTITRTLQDLEEAGEIIIGHRNKGFIVSVDD